MSSGKSKIPYFSNPNVKYDSRKTGKKERKNAEVIRNNGCRLGNIVPSSDPFSIAISAQPVACSCTFIVVSAQVANYANGPIAYSWETSTNGVDWTFLGNNSSESVNVPCDQGEVVFVRVGATDFAGNFTFSRLSIASSGEVGGVGCPQFGSSSGSDNSSLVSIKKHGEISIEFNFADQINSQNYLVRLVDGLGRVINTRTLHQVKDERLVINYSSLPTPGTIVLIDENGEVLESKTIVR